jgi:hypothetical protein
VVSNVTNPFLCTSYGFLPCTRKCGFLDAHLIKRTSPIPFPYNLSPVRLDLIEDAPIFNFERFPYLGRILHRVTDQLALLSQLKIDLFFRILTLDVWHVDCDYNVSALFLQADQIQHNSCEIWSRVPGLGVLRWCLSGDQGVGWCSLSALEVSI